MRLAQELGIHDITTSSTKHDLELWKTERMLKTWVCELQPNDMKLGLTIADCYNADRHIAVRLGRNAVLQQTMTSRWWEDLSDHVHRQGRQGSNDVWTSDLFMLACIAQVGNAALS